MKLMLKGLPAFVVGVPLKVPVPFPLSANVTPFGSAPVSLSAGVGTPVAVTVNVPLVPAVNVVLAALVIDGATGPVDTTMFTADPVTTVVPAAGLSLITSPEGTVPLEAVVAAPTTSPAPVIAVVAAACVSPTTFGTATVGGPVDTTRFTADPSVTEVPAAGFSLITSPEGTVLLEAVVTVPTTSPAPVIAVVAAACVSPTTFGTVTVAGTTGWYSHRSFANPDAKPLMVA
jgi:hypothetical protein